MSSAWSRTGPRGWIGVMRIRDEVGALGGGGWEFVFCNFSGCSRNLKRFDQELEKRVSGCCMGLDYGGRGCSAGPFSTSSSCTTSKISA